MLGGECFLRNPNRCILQRIAQSDHVGRAVIVNRIHCRRLCAGQAAQLPFEPAGARGQRKCNRSAEKIPVETRRILQGNRSRINFTRSASIRRSSTSPACIVSGKCRLATRDHRRGAGLPCAGDGLARPKTRCRADLHSDCGQQYATRGCTQLLAGHSSVCYGETHRVRGPTDHRTRFLRCEKSGRNVPGSRDGDTLRTPPHRKPRCFVLCLVTDIA